LTFIAPTSADPLQEFAPTARDVVLRVAVLGGEVPWRAQALLSHLSALGCDVERADHPWPDGSVAPNPRARARRRLRQTLVVLPERDAMAHAGRALARLEGAVHFIGPALTPANFVALHARGACLYLRDTDDLTESAARLLAFARRMHSGFWSRPGGSAVDMGDLQLDTKECLLSGPGGSVQLTATESRLLAHVASDAPSTPEDLARIVLQRRDVTGRGRDLVYRHVANLRNKLKQVGATGFLERHSAGYRLRR
jgi:DNA-binding response OmpR family regulator